MITISNRRMWEVWCVSTGRCLLLITLFFLLRPALAPAEDSVKIKILAINPSNERKMTTSVVYELPPEVTPKDILDNQGMEAHYNRDKNAYYLSKNVELGPKETKTLVIKVKNVWVLPAEAVEEIRTEIDKKMKSLQGTKFMETGKLLFEKALARIDQIEAERKAHIGIRQQIELFRAHKKELNDIRDGVISLDAMRELEQMKGGETQERVARMLISAENPSPDPRSMTVRAELPEEIKSDDIIDRLDFMVLFDTEKNRYVLEKQDQFAGKESKKYKITLKDIWYIPQQELATLRDQTGKLMSLFKGSNFEKYAQEGADYIKPVLDEIIQLQDEIASSESIEDRIRAFVLNSQKYNMAKKKFKELQDLLLELPLKNEEDSLANKMTKSIKEILRAADVAKLLSMGFDPDISTTWWIIFGIMIFLAILALVFYITWLRKLNQIVWDKKQKAAHAK